MCLLFILYLGYQLIFFRHSHSNSAVKMFSANRSLSMLGVAFSLIATQIGGGAIIGTADAAYTCGIYAIFYSLGLGLGFLLLSFVGASKLRKMEVTTVAEIFEKKYNSRILRKFASVLLILSLFGILIGQIIASRKIFLLCGYEPYVSIVFWGLTVVYIATSGMNAIASMSKLQSFIIYGVFGAILLIVLNTVDSSVLTSNIMRGEIMQNDLQFSTLLVPLLFCLIEQDVAQSFFSASSSESAKKGALIAAVFLVLFSFVPLVIGVSSSYYGHSSEAVLMNFIDSNMSGFFSSVANFGVLMAIVSTANSLMCAISSSITLDFLSKKVKTARLVTLLIGTIAITFGQYSNNLFSVFIESYKILVCGVFFPIFITYFELESSFFRKEAAIVSVLSGVSTWIYGTVFGVNYIEIYCILIQAICYLMTFQIKKYKAC